MVEEVANLLWIDNAVELVVKEPFVVESEKVHQPRDHEVDCAQGEVVH